MSWKVVFTTVLAPVKLVTQMIPSENWVREASILILSHALTHLLSNLTHFIKAQMSPEGEPLYRCGKQILPANRRWHPLERPPSISPATLCPTALPQVFVLGNKSRAFWLWKVESPVSVFWMNCANRCQENGQYETNLCTSILTKLLFLTFIICAKSIIYLFFHRTC